MNIRTIKELGLVLPAKLVVCTECGGEGSIVNPAIGAITTSEFEHNPYFEESYMSGVYDVTCPCCKGRNVELVVDYDSCTEIQKGSYEIACEQASRDYWEAEGERRMGA